MSDSSLLHTVHGDDVRQLSVAYSQSVHGDDVRQLCCILCTVTMSDSSLLHTVHGDNARQLSVAYCALASYPGSFS